VKIDTNLNVDGVLLHRYIVANPLHVSARSNGSYIKLSFHLLLNLIVNNRIKPSSVLLIRPKTRFNRELIFY
jgi:hypothetical protein